MNEPSKSPRSGRQGITFEEVANIASLILAEGTRPTNAMVRMKLGTGSPAKICEYMHTWWSTQQTSPDASVSELSPKLLMAIHAEIAVHVTDKSRSLDELRKAAEEDRDVLIKEIGDLTDHLSSIETNNKKLETEVSEKKGMLFSLRERLDDAIQRQNDIEREREKNALELAAARSTMLHSESMAGDVHELRDQLASKERQLSSSEAMLAAATSKNEQMQIAITRIQSELDSLKIELTKVREAASESADRALNEIMDARRQADKYIFELLNTHASNNRQESKETTECMDQKTKTIDAGAKQNKTMTDEAVSNTKNSPRNMQKQIIENTLEILREGPAAITEIQAKLLMRGIKPNGVKNIRNLSNILSNSALLNFDRKGGGWALVIDRSGQEDTKSLVRDSGEIVIN